jgi:hypothetical protein
MEDWNKQGTIDLFPGSSTPDPALATDYLFGPARGKMFGILEGHDQEGQQRFLYAFSGQYNGRWLVDGWVPAAVRYGGLREHQRTGGAAHQGDRRRDGTMARKCRNSTSSCAGKGRRCRGN